MTSELLYKRYLRLLLRDNNEAVVVNEVTVDVLPKETLSANRARLRLYQIGVILLTSLSQLMLHFPSRAVH